MTRQEVEDGVGRTLNQMSAMLMLGRIAQQGQREQARRNVAASQAKYAVIVARLKHTELAGLMHAVADEIEHRGGDGYATVLLDHCIDELPEGS